MSRGDSKRRNKGQRPWWRTSRGRNRLWSMLFAVFGVTVLAGFIWVLAQGGMGGNEKPLPVGQQVEPFQLPDVVSGETFSLSDYLGKEEVVVVSYMGWF